jgi:hypothetical protein
MSLMLINWGEGIIDNYQGKEVNSIAAKKDYISDVSRAASGTLWQCAPNAAVPKKKRAKNQTFRAFSPLVYGGLGDKC